jgi:hypothetical protein
MNSATASDLLGGSARAAVTDHACGFAVQQADLSKSIRIEVRTLPAKGIEPYLRHCTGAATPIGGLGNQAFACRVKAKRGTVAERVAGSVRNQAFVVEVSTSDRHTDTKALAGIARKAAAQVAGNLF